MCDKIMEIVNLVKELNEASDKYYNTDNPIMTDKEFDLKYDKLMKLEQEENYILSNSPTQNVGFEVKSKLKKAHHNPKLLSLKNTKKIEDLVEFINKKPTKFMLKGDGLTTEIIYKNGELVQASTRGNGEVGEDITHNVKTFNNVPLKINFKGYLKIAGESVILDKDFEKINNSLGDEKKYKNSRALVSGSVRQLDSSICKNRNVNFMAFSLLELRNENNEKMIFDSVDDEFIFLSNLGFFVIFNVSLSGMETKSNIEFTINQLRDCAIQNGIPIDGIVIKFENNEYGNSLGVTAHHPNNAIAFKFEDDSYETTYIKTEWNVSRTGVINPVGIFQPVIIDGTEVKRATLHNVDYFNNLMLGKGDKIKVIKANKIIPKIIENTSKTNTEKIPLNCPVCGSKTKVKFLKTSNVLKCKNKNCPSKKLSQFVHFCKRDCMNIEGLSESILETFINKGFIKNINDIYCLDKYKNIIINLEGFGIKSYNNLIKAIDKSKKIKLYNFIYSLGIPNVGLQTSKIICHYFKNNLNAILKANKEDFAKISDIGQVTSGNMVKWLSDKDNKGLINDLLKHISFIKEDLNKDGIFNNKKIYCTGSFENFSKQELKDIIENNGGTFTSGYAKSLDFLVVGSKKGSSKVDKAKKDNVQILSETEFIEKINK